jgi:endonuclease YncB( thermonuclease family)
MKVRALVLVAVALQAAPAHAARWYTKEGCVLIPHRSNDGDSFHVRHNKREYIYRLYFVDAPETDDSVPDRLVEQAAYFGIEDTRDLVKAGKEAADFTRKFLDGSFTVVTKGEDARGRSDKSRDYAFVSAEGQDLAVELVRAGLARIYGMQEQPPDGPAVSTIRMRLKSAEREAKAARRGAWAYAGGGGGAGVGRLKVPTAAPPRPVVEQEVTLTRSIAYYSLADGRYLGAVPKGTRVLVLRAQSDTMLRIRFQPRAGTFYEVQCKRADLNI